MTPRIVEIRQGILKKNDQLAGVLRDRFRATGVFVVNLVSSPGTGKTALLERTLKDLTLRGFKVAALVGDLETDNDARRLARSGVPVRQIQTHGICHLEAEMIERHLDGWDLTTFDFLFIENVGNLVCPVDFDLGENLSIMILSVPEGDDKPAKYPVMFRVADLVLLTKADLLDVLGDDFKVEAAIRHVRELANAAPVLTVSTRRTDGIGAFIDWIRDQRAARKSGAQQRPRIVRDELTAGRGAVAHP